MTASRLIRHRAVTENHSSTKYATTDDSIPQINNPPKIEHHLVFIWHHKNQPEAHRYSIESSGAVSGYASDHINGDTGVK
ncbi:hypothetical protein ACMFMF_000903 [Clarireedia jacksonii]